MEKKKILICGSTGFIGRNITESLSKNPNYEVYAAYRNPMPSGYSGVRMVRADLLNNNDVHDVINGMDIVIQAAAVTSGAKDIFTRPHLHVTDNAVMNSLIFRAAHEHKVSHVVFFSCTVMYQSSCTPLKETDFDADKEMYHNYFGAGWTKVYLEKMCEFYSRIGDTKYTAIRHSNIYGPYDKFDLERSHVFGATVTKVMNAPEGGEITVWGAGGESRDLLYVSDLVDFVEKSIERQKSKFELFNVGCGEAISIKELVNKIISCTGKNISIRYDLSKPTIKTKLCLDIAKAKKIMGWMPVTSLDEGIKKTLKWYRKKSEK